ncbi:M20 aminoacylase family protein [Comamonas kerstersii]|jgi:amidohydrolase|uniref:Amidohydrolase n=1 Tax=Comamonas kerstersii TaxID=225992 RepID=A0A0W7Z1C0_9BURK|nr:M20 aminoacylase family protein [Comamonas kerstersii]AQZ98707.1 amidohydrolase [Comamonas kerstersii]KAB0587949.1 amidohydrolase [Comamonas kerstersii]KUF41059.1 amidohydrolase [Comamonas kerstersii]MDO4969661.1 M20 aminoacylase family protein [Comamonadaceae bacterium]
MTTANDITPYLGKLLSFRHDMHANPELRYEEHRTADKIAAYLNALGLPIHRGLGKTGIVATIYGKGHSKDNPGCSIGIRADMDALPVQETTGAAHASCVPGKMHACGHDGHTTMLLGAATLLAKNPDFDGTVHLIFQPAEEGGAGAKAMMEDGLFKRFPCDAVFALHNWPSLPQGQMAVRVGPIMASTMRFEIRVRGKGGHAAMPHKTLDPIPVACAIVSQLQTLVSRGVDPLDSAVLTIGKIEGGTVENIIPDEAAIYGTVRTLKKSTQEYMIEGLKRISSHVAAAHMCEATYIHKPGYPNTTNTAKEARFMADVMAELVGKDNAFPDIEPAMTAEDFGFMLEEVPGAYGWIGNGKNGQPGVGLHNPGYDFNDDNIELGSRFWNQLARRWFEQAR